jgi:transposase
MPDLTADPALTCYLPESETRTGENQEVDIDPSRSRAHARESTRTKLGRPEQPAAPFVPQRFAVAADKTVHVVLDNYATRKHPKVMAWLARHQRFTFHFTPTSCSWANAVEGLFAKLTRQRLKRGVFTSIVELQAAINRFITETNDKPKPFVWTKSVDVILAAVNRGRQALEAIH